MRIIVAAWLAASGLLIGRRLDAQVVDLRKVQMIDLTHPLNAQTIYWPTSPSGFELKKLAYGPVPGGWFYSANAFAAPPSTRSMSAPDSSVNPLETGITRSDRNAT